jgi:hypothetical protein
MLKMVTNCPRQMQKEGAAFEQFRSSLENAQENELADITNEIRWLSQAKLMLDELDIMTFLFETQKKEFKYLHHLARSTDSEPTRPTDLQVANTDEQNLTSSANQKHLDSFTDEISSGADSDGQAVGSAEAPKSSVDIEGDLAGGNVVSNKYRSDPDAARIHTSVGAVWTQRGDGLLLNDVESSINDVRGMTERAKRAYKSVCASSNLRNN